MYATKLEYIHSPSSTHVTHMHAYLTVSPAGNISKVFLVTDIAVGSYMLD